jgi:two-component system cell cycle sensor histidine kinase/response regulator CckA
MKIKSRTAYFVLFFITALLLCRNIFAQSKQSFIVISGGNSFRPGLFAHIDGKPDGFYYDLWELWSQKTGVPLNWRLMDWHDTIPALLSGQVDVVLGASYTPERAEKMSFTNPYGYVRTYLFYAQNIGGIGDIEDVEGFPVGILEGTSLKKNLEQRYGKKLKLIGYADYGKLTDAIVSGKITIFIAEEDTIRYFLMKAHSSKQFRHMKDPLYINDLRAAVRNDDKELLAELNKGLSAIGETERNLLSEKWYGSRIQIRIPWQGIILGTITSLFIIGILALWNTLLRSRVGAAVESLKQSEEKFRALIDQAPLSIQVHEPDGTMIMSNKAWSELWGIIGNTHAVGKYNVLEDPQLKKSGYDKEFRRALGGEIVDIPLSVYDPAESGQPGEKRYTHARLYPLKDSEGRVKNVVIMHEDLTEKMKIEEERKELESRLKQSEKLEAIGRLAGGIAHDFNNMLAGIMGYADVLQMNLRDEKLKDTAAGIVRAAKRSAELTDQLLAFARKGRYQSVKLDIHTIIAEVVSLLKHSIDKRIKILQNLHANPSWVMGDPTQLQNAILNLAINASDAMPEGGELIFTTDTSIAKDRRYKELSKELKTGNYLLVSVTDSGMGIPAEIRERIFEPFFTTKGPGKGIGMGLAAVYGIVKSHGGAVSVQSRKGKGSILTILLPLINAENTPEGGSETPEKPEDNKQSFNILVVDDEKIVSETFRLMLRKIGHSSKVFNKGLQAIEYYKNNWQDVDLVILDVAMPDISGRELFRALHKINPLIIALFSSGYSINGEIQKILQEGARGFIQKPFGVKKLAAKINEVMNETPDQ